jgi:hypothetical protein
MIRRALLAALLVFAGSVQAQTVIRVLTVFNPAGKAYVEASGKTMAQVAQEQIGLLNSSLANSYATFSVQSAGAQSVVCCGVNTTNFGSGDIPGIPGGAVAWATQNLAIRQARDAANADVVMVVTHYASDASWTMPGRDNPARAFSGVDAADIPDLAYLHEFGHQMSAKHQRTGAFDSFYNDTTGNGHGTWAKDGNTPENCQIWTTIMSVPLDRNIATRCDGWNAGWIPPYNPPPHICNAGVWCTGWWQTMGPLMTSPGSNTFTQNVTGSGASTTCNTFYRDVYGTQFSGYTMVMGTPFDGPGDAFTCNNVERALRWSNQYGSYRGHPLGDGINDNITVMNAKAPTVANYHLTRLAP